MPKIDGKIGCVRSFLYAPEVGRGGKRTGKLASQVELDPNFGGAITATDLPENRPPTLFRIHRAEGR